MREPNLEAFSHLVWELRFLSMASQAAHWRAFGPSAWGDHALYKLLYEKMDELLDPMAERLTAFAQMKDRVYVCPLAQARYVHSRMQQVFPVLSQALEDPDRTAAFFYEELLHLTRSFRSVAVDIAAGDELTYGTEDLLAGTASELEQLLFFLERRSQVLAPGPMV